MIAKIFSTMLVLAVSLAMGQGPNGGLTPELKNQMIQDLEKALEDRYAYPEVAKKAASSLDEHAKAHDYDSITDSKEFAMRITKDLNDVCHDAHLHLMYSENVLPVRKDNAVPSAEEIKANKQRAQYMNGAFTKVERLDGNIGYISFRNFLDPESAKRPIKAAMEFLANTESLIIDIRQNGGGAPETVQLICSYFFDQKVHLNDLVARDGKHQEFWTLGRVDGPKYLNKDIYILTSKRTGSAAEEFTYDLKCLKRATVIGEPTWGGANPGDMYRLNDHFSAFIPEMHAENPVTHSNWEGTGVAPDIAVEPKDGLDTAYRMALKKEIDTTTDAQLKPLLQNLLQTLEAKKSGS